MTVKNKISYVENGDVTEPIGGTNKVNEKQLLYVYLLLFLDYCEFCR